MNKKSITNSMIKTITKFVNNNQIFILFTLSILFICCISEREGFKAFDQCKNGSYPLDFCINMPFNSEGLYRTWEELEDATRDYH